MIKLYFHPSPNPLKALLMLEETGLPYEIIPVDTFKGEQHEPAFLELNPNAKVPVIVDEGKRVFDSNAILIYLADKTGSFFGNTDARGEVLSWTMFIATGLSPFSGQAVHFLKMAPEQIAYAQNRYLKEVERHYRVLDRQLASQQFLAGADYSIADMATWGWLNFGHYIFGDEPFADYPNVRRLFDEISARPAAQRVYAIKDSETYKTDFDEQTQRALFPQNFR